MSPREEHVEDQNGVSFSPGSTESSRTEATTALKINNDDLIPNAAKIEIAKARLWGSGIADDIARTAGTWWLKEMTNFNVRTIAVTLLVFITVLAPTLTYGALYQKATGNLIGPIETMISTAWVGIFYSLTGGMPMCIVGTTGPVLAFTRALVAIANAIDVPFLTFNLWVSMWTVIYISLAGFFDVPRIIEVATRFTDEIFGLLIVSIYVMDAIGDPFSEVGILRYFDKDQPFNVKMSGVPGYNYMETALLSTILGFGTTALIFYFRSFKFSSYFWSQGMRTCIHDFAPSFSVALAIVVQMCIFGSIPVETLDIPDQVEPTYKCCDETCKTYFPTDCPDQPAAFRPRSWFVSFGDLNGKAWVPMMASGPAFMAFTLLFLDNGSTWHFINQKSHKLRHGEAYSYDLVLNGAFNFINAMLGLPWLVASTVPCLVHLNALSDKDKEGNVICVQETRLTMLLSHTMLALSLLALQQLQQVPMPVLYGVFLFMGMSIAGNIQFWKRIQMFFQQATLYTPSPATDHMDHRRIHVFTVIQIVLFALVFLVQNYDLIAMGFPLMTLFCIPIRLYLLPKYFENWELLLLDGEDHMIKKWLRKKAKVAKQIHLLAMNGGNLGSEQMTDGNLVSEELA